ARRKPRMGVRRGMRGEAVGGRARASRSANPAYSNAWRALSPTRARASSPGVGTGWEERAKMIAPYAIAAVQRTAALRLPIRALVRAGLFVPGLRLRLQLRLLLALLLLGSAGGGLLDPGPALRALLRRRRDILPAA